MKRIAAVLAAAVAAALVVWLVARPATVPRSAPAPSRPAADPSPSGEAVPPPNPPSTRAQPPDPEGETIAYPRMEKLLTRELSAVPHVVIGAADNEPESADLGNIRSFVLLVDPAIDDADLEDLLRDVRARNRDAQFLVVRVFDSQQAAVQPRWVDRGAAASEHQVAELRRSPYYEADKLRVRGRDIAP